MFDDFDTQVQIDEYEYQMLECVDFDRFEDREVVFRFAQALDFVEYEDQNECESECDEYLPW